MGLIDGEIELESSECHICEEYRFEENDSTLICGYCSV